MPTVIFPGPEGRLEGRFSPAPRPRAPVAMILHPHPQGGGTMNEQITQRLYKTFVNRGFATLRFNFRGVGRSQGEFARGEGELSDAASALDWLQTYNENASACWIAGFSFGAWIAMQLLMRRPEINGFVAVAPPAVLPREEQSMTSTPTAFAASATTGFVTSANSSAATPKPPILPNPQIPRISTETEPVAD